MRHTEKQKPMEFSNFLLLDCDYVTILVIVFGVTLQGVKAQVKGKINQMLLL